MTLILAPEERIKAASAVIGLLKELNVTDLRDVQAITEIVCASLGFQS